ncbi:vWA domain-containing protein [Hirschia maritima]|uniref:vWA domain-containing protein n=1 Tax=Hirschia maritima TaxID=1121961 RepID=UPI00037BCEB9|nr:vWA domain-containing protein [Hirschia maritima]
MIKKLTAGIVTASVMALSACAVAAPKLSPTEPIIEEDSRMHAYILLDRTGSMSSIWDEALNSVNTYAVSLGTKEEGEEGDVDADVTLAVFDAQDGLQFDVLRKTASAKEWNEVTNDEASPRGMTPLFDAIGRMVGIAEVDKPEKAVLVIMTDGQENSSREITKEGAKAALDRAREKGWEVVFLGAEFANFGDAQAVGQSHSKSMAVSKDKLGITMNRLAKKSRNYAKGEEPNVEFNEEDRAIADEEEVKQRKGQ